MYLIHPPKFYITFVFHLSWVLQLSQEKLKTMLMQNFGRCASGVWAISKYHKLLFQSKVKCETIDIEMIFYPQANKTYFHKNDFACNLVLKVQGFGNLKWPILRA